MEARDLGVLSPWEMDQYVDVSFKISLGQARGWEFWVILFINGRRERTAFSGHT